MGIIRITFAINFTREGPRYEGPDLILEGLGESFHLIPDPAQKSA